MPPAGRLGDIGQATTDAHFCPACPHPMVKGPAFMGSTNVNINNLPALRKTDMGVHAACCAMNMWTATKGAPHVNINGLPAHRVNDMQTHCGGVGRLIKGSPNVIIGDGGGGGGKGGGPGAGAGPSGGYTSPGAAPSQGGPPGGPPPGAAGGGGGAGAAGGPGGAGGGAAGAAGEGDQSTRPSPSSEQLAEKPDKTAVIEFVLKDQNGKPVPDVKFKITLDDGTVKEGKTDAQGRARVLGLKPGQGKLTFPDLDAHDWKPE
ncbi:MAG TPA: SpaA isopeptide-forming pilin-related protein [Haliangiales bacterium]|nr:SpaA isopeptide-forming pilin-related protein [Haliangiales bacterium]